MTIVNIIGICANIIVWAIYIIDTDFIIIIVIDIDINIIIAMNSCIIIHSIII
jgi:hypothetical protein